MLQVFSIYLSACLDHQIWIIPEKHHRPFFFDKFVPELSALLFQWLTCKNRGSFIYISQLSASLTFCANNCNNTPHKSILWESFNLRDVFQKLFYQVLCLINRAIPQQLPSRFSIYQLCDSITDTLSFSSSSCKNFPSRSNTVSDLWAMQFLWKLFNKDQMFRLADIFLPHLCLTSVPMLLLWQTSELVLRLTMFGMQLFINISYRSSK